MKQCKSCHEEKPLTDFYSNGLWKGKKKYKPDCKQCEYAAQKHRLINIIEEFYGGLVCSRCGYDKFSGALECHHRDPSEKERGIAKMANYSADRIRQELGKCDLVCATCHREIHGDV